MIIQILDSYYDNDNASPGETLDELLNAPIEPNLRQLILSANGDDLTDEEAIEMVASYYHHTLSKDNK